MQEAGGCLRYLAVDAPHVLRHGRLGRLPEAAEGCPLNEYLVGVTRLYLHNSSLTTLKVGDFDGLTALTTLNLNGNQLTSLDLSNNTALIAGLLRHGLRRRQVHR